MGKNTSQAASVEFGCCSSQIMRAADCKGLLKSPPGVFNSLSWAVWLQAAQHSYRIIPEMQSQQKVSLQRANLCFVQIQNRHFR